MANIKHKTSNTKHQTPNIKYQTPNIKHQTANIKQLMAIANHNFVLASLLIQPKQVPRLPIGSNYPANKLKDPIKN